MFHAINLVLIAMEHLKKIQQIAKNVIMMKDIIKSKEKRKLYVKDSFSLEKLLRASSSRNFRLRLYKENSTTLKGNMSTKI